MPLKILLADDQPALRKAMRLALEYSGFVVIVAADGTEARSILEHEQENAFHLLVTDIDMPGCDGLELADSARVRCPGIKVVFTSGQPQPKLAARLKAERTACFLDKPFTGSDLVRCVNELLAAPPA